MSENYEDDIYMSKEGLIPGFEPYKRVTFSKTIRGIGSFINIILSGIDQKANSLGYVPLTSTLISKYETKREFVVALGEEIQYLEEKAKEDYKSDKSTEFNDYVVAAAAVVAGLGLINLVRKIFNEMNVSEYFEVYNSRIYYITRRRNNNTIKNVYVFYVEKIELDKPKGSKIKFKKVHILKAKF